MEGGNGVLLYYKYVSIPDPQELKEWMSSLSSSLSIVGRIRVAPDGINVTVGGTLDSLEKHMCAVNSHPLLTGCDFKLASCLGPINERIAAECGFSSLSVRVVKEVVTLCVNPSIQLPSISSFGKHISALEFHRQIEEAASGQIEKRVEQYKNDKASEQERMSRNQAAILVMDARNVYETRIGRFFPPPGVEFLQPNIRQYSDLPAWIDANQNLLRDKRILMYCTGGVRCEMASSYLKSKGEGFSDVYQLFGGIQRYLEAFPDGGFFKGKNFVFDHRVAVSSYNNEVIGSCIICSVAFDDYTLRCRCSYCRMLVLVCSSCKDASSNMDGSVFTCELCKDNRKVKGSVPEPELTLDQLTGSKFSHEVTPALETSESVSSRPKLRILCLHGFRQNASNLKGRLASFTKKLKQVAEFVFVDAPHEVPFINKNELTKENEDEAKIATMKKKYAWLISPEMMASKNRSSLSSISNLEQDSSILENASSTAFGPMQYKDQTVGWSHSYGYLQTIFSALGPFDGILGFSQGAAVAAALCFLRQDVNPQEASVDFKFAILCSGFLSPAQEHHHWASASSPVLDCPSIHIFGGIEGNDRQISSEASMQLASLFHLNCCTVLKHYSGHIIPTQHEHMDKIRAFLRQFQ